jgi:hypothetical protein
MVKNSEILAGANIFVIANILRISSMAGQYVQVGQYRVLSAHISQATVPSQLNGEGTAPSGEHQRGQRGASY